MAGTTNSLNINSSGVVVYNASTGAFSESVLTQFELLAGGASNAIVSIASGTAGQVLISAGAGAVPAFGAAAGGVAWVNVTSPTQLISPSTGYVTDNASLVTYTLPASPTFGDSFLITGGVTGSATVPWTIAQNAAQQINFGATSTTVGVGGSVSATLKYDTAELLCIVGGSSAVWNVIDSIGNLTIV